MSDSQHDPGTGGILPSVRIGTPERDAAVAALDTHWHAGRLDPGEHERRTTLGQGRAHPDRARRALRRPARAGGTAAARTGPRVVQGPAPAGSAPAPVPEPAVPVLGGMLGRHRDTVMALTPFDRPARCSS